MVLAVPAQARDGANQCGAATVAVFHVPAHRVVAIRVSGLSPHKHARFDGPGFHRVVRATRRGRIVLHVRATRAGRAAVTVAGCGAEFTVRVTRG
jgi:hypothetical protein